MSTPEKVQVIALASIFFFLAYVTNLAIHQALSERSPRPRRAPVATLQDNPKESKAPEPIGGEAKQLFASGRQKARTGDCAGALADFQKAVSLDQSFKDQVAPELDACGKK